MATQSFQLLRQKKYRLILHSSHCLTPQGNASANAPGRSNWSGNPIGSTYMSSHHLHSFHCGLSHTLIYALKNSKNLLTALLPPTSPSMLWHQPTTAVKNPNLLHWVVSMLVPCSGGDTICIFQGCKQTCCCFTGRRYFYFAILFTLKTAWKP